MLWTLGESFSSRWSRWKNSSASDSMHHRRVTLRYHLRASEWSDVRTMPTNSWIPARSMSVERDRRSEREMGSRDAWREYPIWNDRRSTWDIQCRRSWRDRVSSAILDIAVVQCNGPPNERTRVRNCEAKTERSPLRHDQILHTKNETYFSQARIGSGRLLLQP